MKTTIYLSDENMEVIEKLKKKYCFNSASQVINFLLKKESENFEEKIAVAVRKELEENYLQKERIKWATQTAEQNTTVILDVLNTMLHKDKLQTCISVEFAANPVITKSRELIKEKIHYFKEKSDERKSKGKS